MKTLRERQEQHLARQNERALREASRATGYPEAELAAMFEDESLFRVRRLREANTSTGFVQLLRAGVQNFMFDAYQRPAVVYPDLVRVVNSDKAEELYAPLYGTEFPKIVKPGQGFEASRLQGLDVRLKNLKFGRMLNVERELVDDDQTGQIVQRATTMGENVRLFEETLVMNALLAATYSTAIGNAPASNGQIASAPLKAASIALDTMKDPLGNFIAVQADTILVSPVDQFDAAVLLNSALQPSVPGASGQNASTAASGGTGWTMSVNPLQGLWALKKSRFLPKLGLDATNGPWFLLESKKSIVWQDRDPLEVAQEAANAGQSFEHDVYRYRIRRRAQAGVIDSRFIFRGN